VTMNAGTWALERDRTRSQGTKAATRNKECVKGEEGEEECSVVASSSCGKSDVIHRAVRRLRAGNGRDQIPQKQASSSQRIRIRRSVRRVECMQGVRRIVRQMDRKSR
jgi:hypothetical protein